MSDRRRADEIAARLGIAAPPLGTADDELRIWIQWWSPSLEAASKISSWEEAMLRRGGWRPPVGAQHISDVALLIVRLTLRPSLQLQNLLVGITPEN
jgi:hypothetical protein